MKVPILITALALDEEDVQLTKECYDSYMECKTSFIKDITVDTRLHPKEQALTGKWNDFINFHRGKDYDYLMLCANDTKAHPEALEYMVKVMEDNKDIGIMHPVMNRDKENFDDSCDKYGGSGIYQDIDFFSGKKDSATIPENTNEKEYFDPPGYRGWIGYKDYNPNYIKYTSEIFFSPHETANMILRKGVIETVGEFDYLFPHERNEQDFFVRAKRLGVKLATSPMKLFYHPDHSQSDPNRQGLKVADKNFLDKFGTDWFHAIEGEGFQYPFNNPNLDWTMTKKL